MSEFFATNFSDKLVIFWHSGSKLLLLTSPIAMPLSCSLMLRVCTFGAIFWNANNENECNNIVKY